MAYEVVAAIIQGVCTIAAGAIAGRVAAKGIDAWRREAPGRRRVELAEQCLVKAFETKRAVMAFESKLVNFIDRDLGEQAGDGYRLASYFKSREHREEILKNEQHAVNIMFSDLNNLTDLAALYFGDQLSIKAYKLESYFNKVMRTKAEYQNLCEKLMNPRRRSKNY